ncbi:hypothetical protein V12G01_22553 [Vibrio alginolyticus 12G01]|nr:hypothetical protein V12G01_22553 [Vibrio alginolyticus 12G01]
MLENEKCPTASQVDCLMGSYTYLRYVNVQLKLLTWL